MIKTLLTSKRTWVVVFTGLAYVGVKFGLHLDPNGSEALAEQAVVVAGGILTIVTKIIDSKA